MLPLSILNPISLKVGTSLIAEVSSAAGRQLTRRSPVCTSSPHLKTKAKKNTNASTITNKKTARKIRLCLHSWIGVRVHDRYTHSEVGPLLCLSRASGTIVSNALSNSIPRHNGQLVMMNVLIPHIYQFWYTTDRII